MSEHFSAALRILAFVAAANAAAGAASGAVRWSVTGPDSAAKAQFASIFSEQAGPVASESVAADVVFHFGRDAFADSLKLDFETLHPFGYYLVRRGRDIVLAGRRPEGTVFAAYDFLKRWAGYRNFGSPLFTAKPHIETVAMPDGLVVREEPDVKSYTVAWTTAGGFSRAVRTTCEATHAMSRMVPKTLRSAHPEYFPLVNGSRWEEGRGPWNPCITHPDMPKLFRAYARDYFKRHPDHIGLPMGVNDGGGDCNCERCVAVFRRHGNQYVEFYNAAAKILAKEFPGKLLAFIAYSERCREPPADGYQMESNILVEVTGAARPGSHESWRRCGIRHFGSYEYLYALNASRVVPGHYPHFAADFFRRIHRDFGLTTQWVEWYAGSVVYDGARQYVIDELMWNMDVDVDALLDDYFQSMYGPAAKAVRRFFDAAESAWEGNDERKSFIAEYHSQVQFGGYTDADVATMDAALADAAACAPCGGVVERRVRALARAWSVSRLFVRANLDRKRLETAADPGEAVEGVRAAKRTLEAIAAAKMTPKDERDVFLDPAKLGLEKWKSNTRLDPGPGIERAADAAFARTIAEMTPDEAERFLAPLEIDPLVGPFAGTCRRMIAGNTGENLIRNPGFETVHADSKMPKHAASDWQPFGQTGGWAVFKFPGSHANIYTDSSEAHTGSNSVCIARNQTSASLINGIAVKPNARYRISAWVKRNRDNGGRGLGALNVRMKNGNGAWIDDGTGIGVDVPSEAIGKWVEISTIFTTPDREDGVVIVPAFGFSYCAQDGDAKLWIDDVRLELVYEINSSDDRRTDGVPFNALRFGSEFTTPANWPGMRAALERNSEAFDEVWFSTGVAFPPLAWHEMRARQCAAAADDLRRIGIVPSIEIQTIIGHTDDIIGSGDCSGQDWRTMVSADGLAAKHLSCPGDPKLVAYFVRVAELHAAWNPGSVWVDDDLSYRNRAPVLKPGNRLAGCFCDACIAGFSRVEGKAWERAALAQAIRSDAAMRKRWDDYSCGVMGELTRAIAAAVHRVSPDTVMGYQYGGPLYAAIPRGLYVGSGHPVRLRPGAGAYWDTDPYTQLNKAYCLQSMLDGFRGEKWIGACCPEIETCPRTFACRTAQGLILEAFENLALGMDFISMFVADARTDETPDFYADGLFPRLAEAHAFLQGYHVANDGTRPCGFTVPNGCPAKLVACRGVPIAGATGRSLGPLPDVASISVRMAGSGEVDVRSPDYQTRVMQIVSSTGLTNFYARCDRAAGGKMPIVFESAVRAFAIPRVRDDWTLATVAIVNASIDRQDPVTVHLRGVPADAKTAVWHQLEADDVEIALVRDGADVRVRLPRIGAWACGYLSFR